MCCICITSPSLATTGQPKKRHNVRAQQQDAVPDWLNPLPLGIVSASAYMDNVAYAVRLWGWMMGKLNNYKLTYRPRFLGPLRPFVCKIIVCRAIYSKIQTVFDI